MYNVVDCSPFAIAFATHLAYGRDPSELSIIKFNQLQMRNHYLTSLVHKFVREFSTVYHGHAECGYTCTCNYLHVALQCACVLCMISCFLSHQF